MLVPVRVEGVGQPVTRPTTPTAIPAPDGYMPDLRGLSAREALRTIGRLGMTAKLKGSGFVIEQQPAPGSVLVPGDSVSATLGRTPPAPPPSGPPQ